MITEDLIKHETFEQCFDEIKKVTYESNVTKGIFLFYNYEDGSYSIVFRNPTKYKEFEELHNIKTWSRIGSIWNTIDFINNNKNLFSYVK